MALRRRAAKSFYTLLVLLHVSFFDPFEKKQWVSEALGVSVVEFRPRPLVSTRPCALFGFWGVSTIAVVFLHFLERSDMESVADLWGSVKSYVKERLSNPLYGAFLISWAIINFRLVLIFTGSGTWQEKITYIDNRLFVRWIDWCLYGYAFPLLAAMLYLFFAPIVNRGVTVYLRGQDKITVERLLAIEGETPIPKPEAEQLRKGILAERATRLAEQQESSEKLAEQSRQIDSLLAENKKLRKVGGESGQITVGDIALENRKVMARVRESAADKDYLLEENDFVGVDHTTVLTAVSRGVTHSLAQGLHAMSNGSALSTYQVANMLKLTAHKAKVLFDQLLGMKFIEQVLDEDNEVAYRITSAGSQALEAIMHRGFSAKSD